MAESVTKQSAARRREGWVGGAVPPHAYFLIGALFHYLGPAFAVLLFGQVPVLGVALLRIASAAAVFALWHRAQTHPHT